MGHSEYDPSAKDRRPWNAGRKLGRQTRAETSTGLGHQVLAGSRAPATRPRDV